MSEARIEHVEDFVIAVRKVSETWPAWQARWFRGEPKGKTPLLPTLYRERRRPPENELLQQFRAKAPAFSSDHLPDTSRTDQWLFLARHAGLPTRLLDWTESAIIALYFALRHSDEKAKSRRKEDEGSVVWMLNPLRLNFLPYNIPDEDVTGSLREFPLPWHRPQPPAPLNAAAENIAGAWENDKPGVPLPVAVIPSYIHARIQVQRSCFTIHGKRKESLKDLVPEEILKRFEIDAISRETMLQELAVLGVTESMVFPDLDGLARELKMRIFDAST